MASMSKVCHGASTGKDLSNDDHTKKDASTHHNQPFPAWKVPPTDRCPPTTGSISQKVGRPRVAVPPGGTVYRLVPGLRDISPGGTGGWGCKASGGGNSRWPSPGGTSTCLSYRRGLASVYLFKFCGKVKHGNATCRWRRPWQPLRTKAAVARCRPRSGGGRFSSGSSPSGSG